MASVEHDPLDEPAYAPLAAPEVFRIGYNGMKIRMNRMADGLYLASIYWTLGAGPADQSRPAITDPPTSGWGRVLALPAAEQGPLQVMCMWTFRTFRLPEDSHERRSMHGQLYLDTDAYKAEWLKGHLRQRWAELARAPERAGEPDWVTARRAMTLLGIEPPSEAEVAAMPALAARPKPVAAAEPKAPKTQAAATFKPVKSTGRKGEVLKAVLDGKTSVDALTSQFSISRSNLLSQLFLLRKDHGIYYKVSGDALSVQLPEGVTEVFV